MQDYFKTISSILCLFEDKMAHLNIKGDEHFQLAKKFFSDHSKIPVTPFYININYRPQGELGYEYAYAYDLFIGSEKGEVIFKFAYDDWNESKCAQVSLSSSGSLAENVKKFAIFHKIFFSALNDKKELMNFKYFKHKESDGYLWFANEPPF